MRCSKTCFLIFSSLIMMTGGFVLTLSGWFAPAIREAVFRVRMAGPLILLIGFILLLSSCALCAYHQKRCCVCCYIHDKRKNVYPGPEYPFTEHMVELAAPPGLNALNYEYQNDGSDFGKSASEPEPVWHKKESKTHSVGDELCSGQMKPLLPHYSETKSPQEWKLRGCRIHLKSSCHELQDGYFVDDNLIEPIVSSSDDRKFTAKHNQSYHDFYSFSDKPMQYFDSTISDAPCLEQEVIDSKRSQTPRPLRGILKTQSLDRCKKPTEPTRSFSITSSFELTHPQNAIPNATNTGTLEANGMTPSNDIKPNRRPRPLSHSDHTNCPIVVSPAVSAHKQVIILPRPGSYREINKKWRPSPDRSPLLGLPKRTMPKPMATSNV